MFLWFGCITSYKKKDVDITQYTLGRVENFVQTKDYEL